MKHIKKYREYNNIFENNNNSDIKAEFIDYVSKLEQWNITNQKLYNDGYYSSRDLDDHAIFHSYNLYWVADTEDLIEDIEPLDKSIQYFIRGQWSAPHEYIQDYHVHDGNGFREVNEQEDNYLRAINSEYNITEFDEIMSIDYDDWIEFKNRTVDIMRKLNQ